MKRKQLPADALLDLRRRLADLAPRSSERRLIMQETAALYGISESSLYRALRERTRPKALQRADRGVPRILPQSKFERFCEVIAALKIRTSNKKGRHLSTVQAIRLLEEHGVETPDGLLRAPKDVLSRSTVNRYLKQWGFDYGGVSPNPRKFREAPFCLFFAQPFHNWPPKRKVLDVNHGQVRVERTQIRLSQAS